MKMYARLTDGQIGLMLTDEEYKANEKWYSTQNMQYVDVPEDFDFADMMNYTIVDGQITYSPRPLTPEEESELEQMERSAQMDAAIQLFVKSAALTDSQALTVSAFYDKWDPSAHYSEGDRVRYDGKLWKCREEHDAQASWTPAEAHSLWGQVIEPGTVPEWQQAQPGIFDGYEKGQHVMLDGVEWVSIYDGLNVWKPGDVGTESLWERA